VSAAVICGFSIAMAADIHDAVRGGDAALVSRLLKKNQKLVNLADEKLGATPLYHAVDAGNPELVRVLLNAGAKVNVKTNEGMTPMLRAAAIVNPESMAGLSKVLFPFLRSGPGTARNTSREALKTYQNSCVPGAEEEASRLAILRLLVEGGGSMLETMADTQWTPLHVAVAFPNTKAVEYLLGRGADPEASALGLRPLHLAAQTGNAEVAKILIARKANVNAVLPNGARPLHYVVIGDIETVRLLLDHGAEVNAVNKSGAPALHNATWSDAIFNLMLERGADPKLQQSDGTTTLHKACQDGSSALVTKLLQLHPELEGWDGSYFTPLLNAAEAGRVDLLKLLVAAGANPKATQQDGRNALHLAASSESPEAVQYLLDQKLAVNAPNDLGGTALLEAAASGRLETVTLLLRAGASVNGAERNAKKTALMVAAHGPIKQPSVLRPRDRSITDCGPLADYQKIVVLLLDAGADLQARDSAGNTIMHWAACACGNQEVLELLISKGAHVDAKDRNGQTPLHRAAYNADVKTVEALVANGADIGIGDASGMRALHFAAQVDQPEVIRFLLQKGADVAATESHGGTPLHLAVMSGKLEAARMLLDCDAPPSTQDRYKNTPLNMAATAGNVEIVRLLLDHRVPVDVADAGGNTPLHGAALVRVARSNFIPSPEIPVDGVNASVDTINKSQPANKLIIARLLLAKGAKPNVKNQEGATPIDAAAKFGTPEILAALKSQAPSSPRK
jgi:ankyrin repeat protein